MLPIHYPIEAVIHIMRDPETPVGLVHFAEQGGTDIHSQQEEEIGSRNPNYRQLHHHHHHLQQALFLFLLPLLPHLGWIVLPVSSSLSRMQDW